MLLHITNGDGAAALLRAGGCGGRVLPWRDVLHEGPVPALQLAALSRVRAVFLAGRGWGALPALRASFAARDRTMAEFRAYEEIVLWFEHDLYDQLQLMQVLAHLAGSVRTGSRISLICIDRHDAVVQFRGLSDLKPEHVAPLFRTRRKVPEETYREASKVWHAFTSPDPMALQAYLGTESNVLPFVHAALLRHLQEFPSTYNGLGRSAHHALGVVASGCTDPVALLRAHWAAEAAPFMGDWSFWDLILELAQPPAPLVTVTGAQSTTDLRGATLGLTREGGQVLAGTLDAIALRGIDRWYGGVHLTGERARWRWDRRTGRLVGG